MFSCESTRYEVFQDPYGFLRKKSGKLKILLSGVPGLCSHKQPSLRKIQNRKLKAVKNRENGIVANVLCAVLFTFFLTSSSCFAENSINTTAWFEKKLSVGCGGRVLSEILEEIAGDLGISIMYSAKFTKKTMRCNNIHSTVENIINRLFKDYSKGVIINPEKKAIVIQVVGVSGDMVTAGRRSGITPSVKRAGEVLAKKYNISFWEEYQKGLDDDTISGNRISRH